MVYGGKGRNSDRYRVKLIDRCTAKWVCQCGEYHLIRYEIRRIRGVLALNGKGTGIRRRDAPFQKQIITDKPAGIQDDAGGVRIDLHLPAGQRFLQREGGLHLSAAFQYFIVRPVAGKITGGIQ